jgi:predicted dehydrogenase
MKMAFIGFRHGHLLSLYKEAVEHRAIEVVGAAEPDPATAAKEQTSAGVTLTHARPADLIADPAVEVIAIGDIYAARGKWAIEALSAGKHVIADKPLCTSMDELSQIAALAKSKKRSVGCLLDLRCSRSIGTARRLIREGRIGAVYTVTFSAQHPLKLGSRPAWYFEPGQHGGTLNDIAIHAVDLIPWLTGRSLGQVTAARAWNARVPQFPHFQDAAQCLLTLDNGGGVMGDVSYLAPDACGFKLPQYWRFTLHGSAGVIEAGVNLDTVLLATSADASPQAVPLDSASWPTPLEQFIDNVNGQSKPDSLTTASVLQATEFALRLQQAAE